jgi:hypothetical protein
MGHAAARRSGQSLAVQYHELFYAQQHDRIQFCGNLVKFGGHQPSLFRWCSYVQHWDAERQANMDRNVVDSSSKHPTEPWLRQF